MAAIVVSKDYIKHTNLINHSKVPYIGDSLSTQKEHTFELAGWLVIGPSPM